MVLLYELLSLKNTSMDGWLRNTVVIIDPCLNPDGRERYIQWYNQVTGRTAMPTHFSREHEERPGLADDQSLLFRPQP